MDGQAGVLCSVVHTGNPRNVVGNVDVHRFDWSSISDLSTHGHIILYIHFHVHLFD